ncbi:hypothetical protein HYX02_00460 [Candidatus Woesearchaeota archaeon]|nr:hypothetical protein [Candidatus Woesearchaeota archaeon]
MEVIHNLANLSIKKSADGNVGFLLMNKKGSYCSFFNMPSSRYQGLFYFDEKTMSMYKFIENIEIAGNNDASSLKNNFHSVERRKNDIVELFFMPKNLNSLIYELNSQHEINLILDCKESYDNREWGRFYEIFEENGCIVVKFTKKTDRREDDGDGKEEFTLYLVVKGSNHHEKNDKWVERHYFSDAKRNSPPFKRYVYSALKLRGSTFVFSISKSKGKAVEECNYVYSHLEELKSKEREYFLDMLKNESVKKIINNKRISNEVKVAYVSAFNSLNNLAVRDKNTNVFAGLPWFFQFWARDALISLKALSKINKESAEKILFAYLKNIKDDGRLPNLIGQHKSANLGSADAHGWLFLRCKDLTEKINNNKEVINSIKKSIRIIKENKNSNNARIKEYLKKCNSMINKKENEYHKTAYEVESFLEKSLNGLLKFHTNDSFETNNKLETWMDTEFENYYREGIRIEIQAFRLNIYNLLFELTQNHKYKVLENLLRNKLREKFWNGKILADGLNDWAIRPNIFIAHYAYPDLLTNKEWETCFENTLKNLWLEWGGLSTVDKNNPLFTETSTGEDNKSYHRGDSWFWVNNLAALVLNKVNKQKFNKQIQKIISASTEEILWEGCVGCHTELSSAKDLRSEGCWNQAWSNAMFMELIDEMFG